MRILHYFEKKIKTIYTAKIIYTCKQESCCFGCPAYTKSFTKLVGRLDYLYVHNNMMHSVAPN